MKPSFETHGDGGDACSWLIRSKREEELAPGSETRVGNWPGSRKWGAYPHLWSLEHNLRNVR